MSEPVEVPSLTPLFAPPQDVLPQTPLQRSIGAVASTMGFSLENDPLRAPLSAPAPVRKGAAPSYSATSRPLDAAAVTQKLTGCLASDLNRGELRTFQALHTCALHVAQRRGYAPAVSRVTFFCPLEVVAVALGVNRTTVWRHLHILRELGLVDARAHKTTFRGETVNDGYLWCVRLNPQQGKSPRLTYDELRARYRNLSADVEAGRTAHALTQKAREEKMQQSYSVEKGTVNLELLLSWTLPLENPFSPVNTDCCKAEIMSILDVRHAEKSERNLAVDQAASAICYALADPGSHGWYCKLLWTLLRRRDQGQDYFHQFYDMVLRTRADRTEGFARNAGKLLISRLKKWEVWDWLEETPMTREHN